MSGSGRLRRPTAWSSTRTRRPRRSKPGAKSTDHIVTFWWALHRALMRVMRAGPGAAEQVGFVTFIYRGAALLIRLPSGRHLVYRHPRIETNDQGFDEFTYMGSLGGGWVRLRAWPGKVAENVTQAVARDVMVEAMLDLKGCPLVATIHDELIAEVPVVSADLYCLGCCALCAGRRPGRRDCRSMPPALS